MTLQPDASPESLTSAVSCSTFLPRRSLQVSAPGLSERARSVASIKVLTLASGERLIFSITTEPSIPQTVTSTNAAVSFNSCPSPRFLRPWAQALQRSSLHCLQNHRKLLAGSLLLLLHLSTLLHSQPLM